MVFTIVVRELLFSGDIFLGHDENPSPAIDRLAVRSAGVIDVASGIVAWASIDIETTVDTENIPIIAGTPFACRDTLTDVFDNGRTLLNRDGHKQPQTAPGTPDMNAVYHSIAHKKFKKKLPGTGQYFRKFSIAEVLKTIKRQNLYPSLFEHAMLATWGQAYGK